MPYKDGYNVLPKLGKVKGPYFDSNKAEFLREKQKAIKNQSCSFRHNFTTAIEETICNFISQETGCIGDFDELALQVKEDLVVHRFYQGKDWVCMSHVCFPSNWHPEEQIGKSFFEIHQPVPLMRLDNADKIVQAMIHSSPYERSVWTVIFERCINGHPIYPKKDFDINNPQLYIRWERQVIIGFPQINSALFSIGQNIISEADIDKKALYFALKDMKIEHIKYKGLEKSYENLLTYLQ